MEDDYPKSLVEFERCFISDAACLDYLIQLRWGDAFACPKCGCSKFWQMDRGLRCCRACRHQTSVTAGTIFHGARKPLTLRFRAMWYITNQKYGANALGLQRMLNLGSYHTAWEWLHKLRRAMVRPDRDILSGIIQVDETYIGGRKKGKRGRGALGKAVNVEGKYSREVWASIDLKLPHLIAAFLKRWLLSAYQGAARRSHLDYYLDEYTFRFNRGKSKFRGKLFYRSVQQALMVDPQPRSTLKTPNGPSRGDEFDI